MDLELRLRDKVTNFEHHYGVQSVVLQINEEGIVYDSTHTTDEREDNLLKRLNIEITGNKIRDENKQYNFNIINYFKDKEKNNQILLTDHARDQLVNCLEALQKGYITYFDIDPKENGESMFIGDQNENVHFHIKGSRGNISNNILLIFDNQSAVTRRNIELQVAYKALEYMANLGEKIADVAHELKRLPSQAGAMINYVIRKLNEHPIQNGEKEKKCYTKILEILNCTKQSIDTAEIQINNLNDYTRNKVSFRDISLNHLIENIITTAQYDNPSKKIIKEKYERVPNIYGDIGSIESIARNLIYNGLQKDSTTVMVSLYQDQGNNIIEIKDDGTNIPDISKIFERGFTTKTDGNGLGLPIVKQSIDLHKGKIEVYNNPVTFKVYLPVKPFEL